MNFYVFILLADGEDSLMLLEQNNQNVFLARFYYANISFEDMNFGIVNTRHKAGFETIGGSMSPNWKSLTFKEFISKRKWIGLELQNRLDELFQMTKNKEYDCYEGSRNYIIHVPEYYFRISGPKTKFPISNNFNDDSNVYFIKITDNDWRLKETIADGFVKIPKNNFNKIIEAWSPFLSLLMTESKYA